MLIIPRPPTLPSRRVRCSFCIGVPLAPISTGPCLLNNPKPMKLLITSLLAVLAFNTYLFAQGQVEYGASPGQRAIHNLNGTPVANGNSVWLGTFTAGFNVAANANDPAALLANWHPFGDGGTTIRTIIQPGRFSDTDSSTDAFFAAKKIYWWIFSTDSAATPAPDFNNVNE